MEKRWFCVRGAIFAGVGTRRGFPAATFRFAILPRSSFITDNEQHLAECNTVSSPPCRLLAHLDTSIMARIDGTTLLVGVRPAHSLVRDKLVTTSWTPLRHAGLARSLEGIFLRAFRRVKSWMSPRYATALCTVYLKHHQAFGCRPALHCTFIP
jgi:hypothetical protein